MPENTSIECPLLINSNNLLTQKIIWNILLIYFFKFINVVLIYE